MPREHLSETGVMGGPARVVRTGIYVRISPKPDENKEVLAIERQVEACYGLCDRRGWTAVTVYKDESVSATSRKPRPAYEQMLQDMRDGKLDAVVAWDLDRLHRKIIELETFIEVANANKIELATEQGFVDISKPDGRAMARMKAVFARQEIEQKSQRQVAAAQQRAQKGEHWGPAPFGYRKDGKKLVPDPVTGPLVQQMYSDLLAGSSQRGLALALNALDVKTTYAGMVRSTKPLKGQWRQATVRQMMLNPVYAGKRGYKGKIIGDGNWEPLVDYDTWRAAQTLLASRPATGKRSTPHLLSGIARCGFCDTGLNRRMINGTPIYCCPACLKIGRNAARLDEYVTEAVLALFDDKAAAAALVQDQNVPDYAAKQDQIEAAKTRQEGLMGMWLAGKINEREWQAARDTLQGDIDQLERSLIRARSSEVLSSMVDSPTPRDEWAKLPDDKRRAIIRQVLKVTVLPCKRRGVRFDPSDVLLERTAA